MTIKAYIKMCMLLVLLSFISGQLSSQVIEPIIKESADSTFQSIVAPGNYLFVPPDDSLSVPIVTRSCVNTFTNQTVSTYLYVTGCNTLAVQNVTVTNSGHLLLSAPGDITINGPFDVVLGGQLEVAGSTPPPPPGNTLQTAINIGTFGAPFQYTNNQNTLNFTNDYVGRPTNDVFYVFTITTPMNVTIKHCNSSINTYVHLLDASGASIAYNDDYSGPGACGNTQHAYLTQYLVAGTYYIVSEGYNTNGAIQTSVDGVLPQLIFNYMYDNSGNRISRTVAP